MAALESGIKDVTNMMASAALKPKRAASPPPRPKSAHNSPVRKALFVPKGASEMKKRELAGSYEDFTPEPLLMENPNRFVLFPIEHADVWRARGVRKVFSRCVAATTNSDNTIDATSSLLASRRWRAAPTPSTRHLPTQGYVQKS